MITDRDLLVALASALARNPGATTSELAASTGTSRATLNRRFASRRGLVQSVAAFALESCEEVLERPGSLRTIVEEFCARGAELAVLLHLDDVIEPDPELNAKAESLLSLLHTRIQHERHSRSIRHDFPARWQTRVLADLVWTGWAAVQAGEIGAIESGELVWRSWLEGQQSTERVRPPHQAC